MPAQYEGHDWLLVEYKGNNKYAREKVYEKFHEIPPFNVKADPSILINNEDYPWLRRNKQMTQAKKK